MSQQVRDHIKKMEDASRQNEQANRSAQHPEQENPRPGSVLAKLLEKNEVERKQNAHTV